MNPGSFLRYIYSILFYLATPLVLLRLLWRANKSPEYAFRWRERFGFIKPPEKPKGFWLHAVSLGEVIAAAPLIHQLRKTYPQQQIIVTTLTPTGSARVRSLFGNDVYHVYAPYDLPDAVYRFLNRIQPTLVIMIETELWPNIFAACHRRNIPLLIANARLSPQSIKGYAYIKWLTQDMLNKVTKVAAQTQLDAKRFLTLGIDPKLITITGSIKFDMAMPPSLLEKAAHIRQLWGTNRSVWIAASTHEGEDELILAAYKQMQKRVAGALLVLVPRHPERFSKVAHLCQKHHFSIVKRSEQRACENNTDIFIGDSIGELYAFYAASDVAFVGGSLVPTGGHNPLEPAACGIPIITGPHTFNFVEVFRLLNEANAVKTVTNPDELANALIIIFNDVKQREQMIIAGRKVVDNNRGALDTHMQLIAGLLA